jgi:hypothetical protein
MHFESILIACGFVMVIFAIILHGPAKAPRTNQELASQNPTALPSDERVEFYKRQIGERLNSQRIGAQYENLGTKSVSGANSRFKHEPVLDGVPLAGEKHPVEKMQKPPEQKPSVEGEIEGFVAFERNLRDWEENARKQYIAEFMARAEAMGYRVQIDRNYNVLYEYVGERVPQSAGLLVPLSILAPRCQL